MRRTLRGVAVALTVLGTIPSSAPFVGCSSDSSRGVAANAGRAEVYVAAPPPGAERGEPAEATPESNGRGSTEVAPARGAPRVAPEALDDEVPFADGGEAVSGTTGSSDSAVSRDRSPVLVATAKVTNVYRRPSFDSAKLGYLRAGAVVRRRAAPASKAGCPGGFYEIEPGGFVCAGETASLDENHAMARAASRRADRTAPLPYVYGIAPFGRAPLYTRIPTRAEQRVAEPDLETHLARARDPGFDAHPSEPIPWFLEGGRPAITVHGYRRREGTLHAGIAIPNSGAAFVSIFESEGRRFGLTVDMDIVPLDRYRAVSPSRFHGLPLGGETTLPVVFVRSKSAALYRPTAGGGIEFERRLAFREAVPVSGASVRIAGARYLQTQDGRLIKDEHLIRVDPLAEPPRWAAPGRTWLDISITRQTLVAYEGDKPVFVTLVSTGADGLQDPETTRATVQGQFRVHTKHVSITMSSDEVGEEFDLRDVPYVQYFTKGYALHAAYWHDGFGAPRSHGCVNLSPLDARWLFGWTDPPVPSAWHGAMSLRDGTLVSIHP